MGMDPISKLEVHEVIIQVSGPTTASGTQPVNVKGYNEFQVLLREFIKDASAIVGNHPDTPVEKLQVRVVRQHVRSTAQ